MLANVARTAGRQARPQWRTLAAAAESHEPPITLYGIEARCVLLPRCARFHVIRGPGRPLPRSLRGGPSRTPPLPPRYANATYTAASKQKVLPKVESELLAFKAVMEKNAAFKGFLSDPTVARDTKVSKVQAMLKGQSQVTQNLFVTMAANAKLADAGQVIEAFEKMMKADRNEIDAEITSAEPLTKAEKSKVEAALKTQAGKGAKILLTETVDPSLLGGLQVQIGDKFMDLSVASKVTNLKRSLGSA